MPIVQAHYSPITIPLLLTRLQVRFRRILAFSICLRPWFMAVIAMAGCGQVDRLDEIEPVAGGGVPLPSGLTTGYYLESLRDESRRRDSRR
jgi:hypothetical protein